MNRNETRRSTSRWTLLLLALTLCACESEELRAPAVAKEKPAPEVEQEQPRDFSEQPDFRLPAPIERSTRPAPLSEKSRLLTSDDVRLAVLQGMGPDGMAIQVEVDQGLVSLSGEVESIADLQRANYLARAVEGVIEVDQRRLKVRN